MSQIRESVDKINAKSATSEGQLTQEINSLKAQIALSDQSDSQAGGPEEEVLGKSSTQGSVKAAENYGTMEPEKSYKYSTKQNNWILIRLERDLGAIIAVEFLQAILESNIAVLYPTKQELIHAYRFFKNNSRSQINMSEIINSKLMDKQGVSLILTYDFWRNTMGTSVSPLTNS